MVLAPQPSPCTCTDDLHRGSPQGLKHVDAWRLCVEDRSVYEFFHDLISGRQRPQTLPPLEVVADGEPLALFSLSNRRTLMLLCYQASKRHECIRVPCKLFAPRDSQVALRYSARDSLHGHGLGIELHGKGGQEAYHMGAPLFRRAEEWMENLSMPLPMLSGPPQVSKCEAMEGIESRCSEDSERLHRQSSQPADYPPKGFTEAGELANGAGSEASEGSGAGLPEAVCCLWLQGKCGRPTSHLAANRKRMYLHEDVAGMPCGYGDLCWYQHFEARSEQATELHLPDTTAVREAQAEIAEDLPGQLKGQKLQPQCFADAAEQVGDVDEEVPSSSTAVAPEAVPLPQNTAVCCEWLQGICSESRRHLSGKCLLLHSRVEALPCNHGETCKYHRPQGPTQSAKLAESGSAGEGRSSERAGAHLPERVCCLWLEYKCWKRESHLAPDGRTMYLHEDVAGMPCGYGDLCRCRHYEARKPELTKQEGLGKATPAHAHQKVDDNSWQDVDEVSSPIKKQSSLEDISVCCFWLRDKCREDTRHWSGKRLFLHTYDARLPCSYGEDCTFHRPQGSAQAAKPAESGSAGEGRSSERAGAHLPELVCCVWLEGKCGRRESHLAPDRKRMYLHKDVAGMPCGYGHRCRWRHYEARSEQATESHFPETSGELSEAFPGLRFSNDISCNDQPEGSFKSQNAQLALPWAASGDDDETDMARLKEACQFVDEDDDENGEQESAFEDDLSLCTESKDETMWEEELKSQTDDLHQLPGTLVLGTFRCVSGGPAGDGTCGAVLVEDGPRQESKSRVELRWIL